MDPRPCAGTFGTTITVEDLFYNMQTRRQAFKNPTEQYQRILDVVTKYSVHFGDQKISFTCKKQGQPMSDLHTPINSTTLENIKIAYGASVSRELINFELKEGNLFSAEDKNIVESNKNNEKHSQQNKDSKKYTIIHDKNGSNSLNIENDYENENYNDNANANKNEISHVNESKNDHTDNKNNEEIENDNNGKKRKRNDTNDVSDDDNDVLAFSMTGLISNANYSSKKGISILFINNRLVECLSIKRVIEAVYADILPRHSHPFIYLSISMPPQHVDVNVHPVSTQAHSCCLFQPILSIEEDIIIINLCS